MRGELEKNLKILTGEKRIISGISVAYGGADWSESLFCGRSREVVLEGGAFRDDSVPVTPDTIYDLASVTKLFTGLILMLLFREGKLSPEDPVGKYDSRFTGIADVPLIRLMRFSQPVMTPERIDAQADREHGLAMLFGTRKTEQQGNRFYTDIGAMALKYAVEGALDQSFFEAVRSRILLPLGMHNTFSRVPGDLLDRTASYNYERRCVGGVYTVDTGCPPGTVHDYKARLLSDGGRDLCGHAGLFSTLGDLVILAGALLGGKFLPLGTIREMGMNRTGALLPDGTFSQHLGTLCFAKNPDQTFSEVPERFGYRTVALNGYTGNHFSVDPDRGEFMILLSNRIHNRVTAATGRANPYETQEWVDWPDGNRYPLSQNYVFCKDRMLKGPVARLLEERASSGGPKGEWDGGQPV